jgi:DNA-directed RNA polymerase specialized sigma24 family protein
VLDAVRWIPIAGRWEEWSSFSRLSGALSPPCRCSSERIYELAARDGLDDREIADWLGINCAEVRRHLAAALARIASSLNDRHGD